MGRPRGYIADATIRVSRFVSHDMDKEHRVVEADGTQPIVGISQEGGKYAPLPSITTDPPTAAETDDQLNVYMPGDYALVIAGGTIDAGDLVVSNGSGAAVAMGATGTVYVGGRAEQDAVSGQYVLVFIAPQVIKLS